MWGKGPPRRRQKIEILFVIWKIRWAYFVLRCDWKTISSQSIIFNCVSSKISSKWKIYFFGVGRFNNPGGVLRQREMIAFIQLPSPFKREKGPLLSGRYIPIMIRTGCWSIPGQSRFHSGSVSVPFWVRSLYIPIMFWFPSGSIESIPASIRVFNRSIQGQVYVRSRSICGSIRTPSPIDPSKFRVCSGSILDQLLFHCWYIPGTLNVSFGYIPRIFWVIFEHLSGTFVKVFEFDPSMLLVRSCFVLIMFK